MCLKQLISFKFRSKIRIQNAEFRIRQTNFGSLRIHSTAFVYLYCGVTGWSAHLAGEEAEGEGPLRRQQALRQRNHLHPATKRTREQVRTPAIWLIDCAWVKTSVLALDPGGSVFKLPSGSGSSK